MLIGIDASRAGNEQKTGVEWYAWHVIQELKKLIPSPHRVVLYTREKLHGELGILPSHWEEGVLDWPPRRLWTQMRLSREMLAHPPDALFVPAHVAPLAHPKRTVVTIHDLGGMRFPSGYSLFERWYGDVATRMALRDRGTEIIVPSRFTADELHTLCGADRARMHVAYNGYDHSLFHADIDIARVDAARTRYGLAENYVMSISRLEEKKNTIGIIQGFELWCDSLERTSAGASQGWRLLLLGKPGFGYEQVNTYCAQSRYADRMVRPGWVETKDVPALMKGAYAFVFPSFYEGFGIPAVEAMAAGTPVIASYAGSLPEVCHDGALYVNPFRPAEIARELENLARDEGLRAQLIDRGLARAKQFRWELTAREILKYLLQ